MRTGFALALFLAVSTARADPDPAETRQAKAKLDALKQRLPGIVKTWGMEINHPFGWPGYGLPYVEYPRFRRLRATSPTEARLTVSLHCVTGYVPAFSSNPLLGLQGVPVALPLFEPGPVYSSDAAVWLTFYLAYHDGVWTGVWFEPSLHRPRGGLFSWLDAIDAAAEEQ